MEAKLEKKPALTQGKAMKNVDRLLQKVELIPLEELIPDPDNVNTHTPGQIRNLVKIIKSMGWTDPILLRKNRVIMAGEGRYLAAKKMKLSHVPCIIGDWTDEEAAAFAIAHNAIGKASKWDLEKLRIQVEEISLSGFDTSIFNLDISPLNPDGNGPKRKHTPRKGADSETEPFDPICQEGDVWTLGRHSLFVGSSTSEAGKDHLQGSDLVLTDPPYCSGGFQEGDRSVGSVGTRSQKHRQIANDTLSTRGYQSLMRSAVFELDAPFFYVFTDWRMWTSLFDMAEAGGAGVRSMIVWDKQSLGMGAGWRAQHELILFGARQTPPFQEHRVSAGNVISHGRQRNELHKTQKPLGVIKTLLENAPFCQTVSDPFGGSGTTLIACEEMDRTCRINELDPLYCDTIIQRWQDHTGQHATRSDGVTFESLIPEGDSNE